MSTTFERSAPHSVPIPLLVEYHAKHHPDAEYAVLAPSPTQGETQPSGKGRKVTWTHLNDAVLRGAHLLNPLTSAGTPTRLGSVIALLAVTDNLLYQTLNLSIVRSGNIVSVLIHLEARSLLTVVVRSRSQSRIAILPRRLPICCERQAATI